MKNDLLVTLINNGVIRKGTEVVILRSGRDMSGNIKVYTPHSFEIGSFKVTGNEAILTGCSIVDGKKFYIKAKNILSIDGMDPRRLKTAFQSEGKKRGRKPNPK